MFWSESGAENQAKLDWIRLCIEIVTKPHIICVQIIYQNIVWVEIIWSKVSHTVQVCLFSSRPWGTKNHPNVTWSKLRIFPLSYGRSWNCSCAFIAFHRITPYCAAERSNSASGKTATAVQLMCQSKQYRMMCCKWTERKRKKKDLLYKKME